VADVAGGDNPAHEVTVVRFCSDAFVQPFFIAAAMITGDRDAEMAASPSEFR
jgi:hypothetical protein